MLKVLSLFAGIGGFDLGLERTNGFKTVAFCEIDPFCRRVLAKHWPEAPCYHDVRELTAEQVGEIDVICGGFPCQDVSESNTAGLGLAGARSGLWAEFLRLIRALRPSYVIVENVSNLAVRGLGRVLGDLASSGYDAEWRRLGASDVGAPHDRQRVWIVAHPAPSERRPHSAEQGGMAREHSLLSWAESAGRSSQPVEEAWREPWPAFVDRLSSLDDGLSCRVDEFNGLANAVVPQIPELIGRAILSAIAIEAASAAETVKHGSVHESAGPKGIARKRAA